MPDQLQLRGGTTTEHNSFTGVAREVTVDTTKKTLVVHDGSQAGGTPLMKESGANASSSVSIGTGGTNALNIDSNQKVLIGHGSSRTVGDRTHLIQVEGTALHDGGLSMVRNRNDEHSTSITLAKTRGSSNGANTIVQNNDSIGEFAFAAADGTDVVTRAARIHCEIDGTPSANDMPARLLFSTTADGGSSPAERMRLDSSGRLLLGTTTEGNAGADDLTIATTGSTGITIRSGNTSNGNLYFSDGTSGDLEFRGSIQYQHANNALVFATNSIEAMRVDYQQNVAIGTSTTQHDSAHYGLTLAGRSSTGAGMISFMDTSGNKDGFIFGDNGHLYFTADSSNATADSTIRFRIDGSSEKARIDHVGRLLIGETSPLMNESGFNEILVGGKNEGAAIHLQDNNGNVKGGMFTSDQSLKMFIRTVTNHPIEFRTNNTNQINLDTSGNFLFQREASSNYPTQQIKWSNDSTTTNGFYIAQHSDRNGRIWHEQGLSLDFGTTNQLRMTIDPNGQTGINTASPAAKLHVMDGDLFLTDNSTATDSGQAVYFQSTTNGWATNAAHAAIHGKRGTSSSGYIRFDTRLSGTTSEKMRIDASGRVLIGHTTSTPMDNDANNPIFAVEGAGNGARIAVRSADASASNGAFIYLTRTRGTTAGSKTTVQSGDSLGGLIFMGADGTHDTRGAIIQAQVDGAVGDNDMPARLVFMTTPDGGINSVERMRINSSGDIHIGRTDTLNLGANNVTGINLLASGRILASSSSSQSEFGRQGSNGEVIRFACQGTGNVGSIDVTTSSTSYNTSSDYRLKENITAISDGITRLKTLKPSRFNFKIDKDKTVDGFLAHEVTAVPEAITGTKDEVATEDNELAGVKKGDPIYQKIDQSKLIPLLVAAVQELIGKVEALEAA